MVLRFDSTLGAAFCGFAGSSILYGVLCAQVYAYFQRYVLDRPFYKFLVLLIWTLETFHQALVAYTVYYYSITNFTRPTALLFPVWTLLIQVTVGALISVIVKGIFAMRVWRFSNHNIPLTILIGVLILAQFGLALAFTVESFTVKFFGDIGRLKPLTTLTLTTSVAADIIIAGSLIWFLHHLRSAHAPNTLVNGLIRYSVETGGMTSVCGLCTLIFFDVMPLTFAYLAFYFVLSKLYSNSLLVTLNTRLLVRGRGTDRERGTNPDFTIIHTTTTTTTTTHPRIELNQLQSNQEHNIYETKEPAFTTTTPSHITSPRMEKPPYTSEW
ncbi:hypothetical protein BD410DRAFT_169145 [Rickenella mellea]|uniref:DUF6534 domain-containing protein n=1 Tax=Rickenella mellea TaxID=50990 RepID=A0A4Y7Q648_9AGAM|nr:hypothetical protein BD410DRAFT_169145 [Rickenella mellea]